MRLILDYWQNELHFAERALNDFYRLRSSSKNIAAQEKLERRVKMCRGLVSFQMQRIQR